MEEAGMPWGPRTKVHAKNKASFRGHAHRARYDACEPGGGGRGIEYCEGKAYPR